MPAIAVPTGAVPNTIAVLPAADWRSTPTAGPLTMFTGVAAATCGDVPARSNTVSHWREAAAAPVGRISVRHILFHAVVSVDMRSVVVMAALAGSTTDIAPANSPLVTSNRRTPPPGD